MQTTPLTEWHRRHGAKLMEFGGYQMPLEYVGILREHEAVRTRVGMFDVSHMAEFQVGGPGAPAFLDAAVTNWPSRLAVGQALYSPMCRPDGGTVDDLLVYRLAAERFWLVVNAANHASDWQWLAALAEDWAGVERVDVSADTALIAVQGPDSLAVLEPLAEIPLAAILSYHFVADARIAGVPALIARTGYTGEDGFELYVAAEDAESVWQTLFERGVLPIGLGARDTLRLEARLPLYGHELSAAISPLEAGLAPFVKWDKGDFVGRDALARQQAQGLRRRIAGLVVTGGIARAGYPVLAGEGGEPIGLVTSGSHSPTLKEAIALALLPTDLASPGTALAVRIRDRAVPATVVRTPFYKRGKKGAATV
ncbi:MAG: glycine cleavage system aminomethyltransferase GcvT [Thermaerobacter sp.]|nr:glycine cleavage system aminomethyltransferase GcvT [Thermaerobacter sp.]